MNDSSALGRVLDELLTGDTNYHNLTAKILRHQRRLRKLTTKEAFVVYLDIEEVVNARVDFMLGAAARFAFNEGRRHQRHGRG